MRIPTDNGETSGVLGNWEKSQNQGMIIFGVILLVLKLGLFINN